MVTLTKCFESGLVSLVFNAKRAYKDPENLLKTLRGKQPVLLSLLTERCFIISAAFADFHGRKTLLETRLTREESKHQPYLKASTNQVKITGCSEQGENPAL